MERILERHERYSSAEGQLVAIDTISQGSWTLEHAKLKARIEVLQKNQRHYMGEDLDSLSLKELQSLETQLDSALKNLRSRKNQMMFESISQIQKKDKALQEQNNMLSKKDKALQEQNNMLSKKVKNKEKELAPLCPHEQQNQKSSPLVLQKPMQPFNVTGDVFQAVGNTGDHEGTNQTNTTIPSWMLSHINNGRVLQNLKGRMNLQVDLEFDIDFQVQQDNISKAGCRKPDNNSSVSDTAVKHDSDNNEETNECDTSKAITKCMVGSTEIQLLGTVIKDETLGNDPEKSIFRPTSLLSYLTPVSRSGSVCLRSNSSSASMQSFEFPDLKPVLHSSTVSLRSNSSSASTQSFAFPVFISDTYNSPEKMVKAEKRCSRQRRQRQWLAFLMCRCAVNSEEVPF
ncbi:hypothetical protein POM88_004153 [Heracleum sosnowskyi]|uniref:K-box domain-containing protein n=1 Tax=Heracleum sosnowskyi TaxID=360622 RepID=A0AAD8JJU8_9APIA|nr:hypothetical protein POM88_004153 [Heracleum sosnowskyi]